MGVSALTGFLAEIYIFADPPQHRLPPVPGAALWRGPPCSEGIL